MGPVQEPLSLQPLDPSIWSGALFGEDGGQASHRTASVQDQDGFAVANLVDERAEVVLRFGESGRLHLARLAISTSSVNQTVTSRLAANMIALDA